MSSIGDKLKTAIDSTVDKADQIIAQTSNVYNVIRNIRTQKDWHTLDIIKERGGYHNPLKTMIEKSDYLIMSNEQKHAFYIQSLADGSNEFYKNVLFQDTIRQMANKFVTELTADLTFKSMTEDEHGEHPEIEEINSVVYNFDIKFVELDFETLFEYVDIFGKSVLKINVINGKLDFEVVPPYRYKISRNKVIFYFQDIEGKLFTEIREDLGNSTRVIVKNETGKVTSDEIVKFTNNGMQEFTFTTFTSVGHELIKAYDLMESNIINEVMKNSTKVFGDKNLFRNNPINKDFIHLVDIPESQILKGDGSKNVQSTMLSPVTTNFSLNDIIASANKFANTLVIKRGLSKKTLGLDSSSQDFASSLPYENDLTAKTINQTRKELEPQLQKFFLMLTGKEIIIDLGLYKLISQESITSNNKEANGFRSIRRKVANELQMDEDAEEVILESFRVKMDTNIEPDLIEISHAIEAGIYEEPTEPETVEMPFEDDEEIVEE